MTTTTRKRDARRPQYFDVRQIDDDATTDMICAAIIKGTETYVRIAFETTQVRMTTHQADAFLCELFQKILATTHEAVMQN